MIRIAMSILFGLVILATPVPTVHATELGPVTNLPIPRFVSLRSSEINVRRGPGLDYRKDWVYRRAGLPVQVIEEYGPMVNVIPIY